MVDIDDDQNLMSEAQADQGLSMLLSRRPQGPHLFEKGNSIWIFADRFRVRAKSIPHSVLNSAARLLMMLCAHLRTSRKARSLRISYPSSKTIAREEVRVRRFNISIVRTVLIRASLAASDDVPTAPASID